MIDLLISLFEVIGCGITGVKLILLFKGLLYCIVEGCTELWVSILSLNGR